jgi:threonylcarbamoyladenosine tRNA methylthiotransferase MtaB
VTGRADATCRNLISRTARNFPSASLVVIGCYVDLEPQKIAGLDGVDMVVKNSGKDAIVEILGARFPKLFDNGHKRHELKSIRDFHQHNRAWIKISDGCDQHCAYCIIPRVRGRLVHRPADDIIEEINSLSDFGYREVVLTGVHIGRYKQTDRKNIAELLQYILSDTSIERVRLSSIEPQEVDDNLLSVMAANSDRICRHLHIPLQSGSDRILKLMHRPYDSAGYLEIADKARKAIPGLVIGADIIVGFPGETDDDFNRSVGAVEAGEIDYVHAFSYSDRPGTESEKMPDKINPDAIKNRNRKLRDLSAINYARALMREVGKEVKVISEHRAEDGLFFWGITDNYLKVAIPEGHGGRKDILNIEITEAASDHLIGRMA